MAAKVTLEELAHLVPTLEGLELNLGLGNSLSNICHHLPQLLKANAGMVS
jgi:hypothetical protein